MLSLYCGKATESWWETQMFGTLSGLVIGVVGTVLGVFLTQYFSHKNATKLESEKARLLFVNSHFIKSILDFVDSEVLNMQKIHNDYYNLQPGEELTDDLTHRERAASVISSVAMFKDKKLDDIFGALLEQRNKVITSHSINKLYEGEDRLSYNQLVATVNQGINLAADLKLRISELCSSVSR